MLIKLFVIITKNNFNKKTLNWLIISVLKNPLYDKKAGKKWLKEKIRPLSTQENKIAD